MENPITKFAPFLVGEFPKPFQELLDKVTSNEPLTEDDLKKEFDEKGLELIARKADGSMRDALGYLDQVMNYCEEGISLDAIQKILGVISDETNVSNGVFVGVLVTSTLTKVTVLSAQTHSALEC